MTARQKAWLLPAAAVAVTLGILLGRLVSSVWPGVLCVLLSLSAAFLLKGMARWAACLLVSLTVAMVSSAVAFHPVLPPEGDAHVTGIVGDEIRPGSNHQWKVTLYHVNVNGDSLSGGAYWTFYADTLPEELLPGKWVSLDARLYHPGGQSNPDGYNFKEALLREHITVGIYGMSDLVITDPPFFSLPGCAASLRHALSERLVTLLGDESGGYATALILGSRSLIPLQDREAFSRLGIAHVLSVSGFHVGILVGCLAFVFRLLGLSQRIRLTLYAVILLSYSALCGFGQPVLRASLFTLLALEGKILQRPRSGLHLLCAAYVLLAVLSPPQLTGASFQLSFGAMLGLVTATPFLSTRLVQRVRFPRYLLSTLCAFLGAQLGILLPELAFFQRLPLLALFLNVPVGLLSAGIILLDWLVLLLSPVPCLAALAAVPAARLTSLLTSAVRMLGSFPGISLWTPAPGFLTAAGVLLLLFCTSAFFHFRKHLRLPLLCTGILMTVLSLIPGSHSGTEYIQFSVGNADAALLWDQNQLIVLDTGEADGVLSGFLRRHRLTPDAVILTHLHMDHMGGLASLLSDGIPIRLCYLPWGAMNTLADEHALELLNRLEASGTEIRFLSRGDLLPLPSGSLSVLWPEAGKVRPGRDPNESSLTVLLTLQGVSVLQTGDLDGRYESYAAASADILKVAHHGSVSSTSQEFLEAVSPQAALLSCAWPDRHLSVAERLKGIPVFSTAMDGAIRITFSPGRFRIIPFLNRSVSSESASLPITVKKE